MAVSLAIKDVLKEAVTQGKPRHERQAVTSEGPAETLNKTALRAQKRMSLYLMNNRHHNCAWVLLTPAQHWGPCGGERGGVFVQTHSP